MKKMNEETLSNILKENDLYSPIKSLNLLKGGANNRVYKITWDSDSIILKEYFSNKNDKRNRLNSEFSFLSFLWQNKIRCIPKPIKKIEKNNIGIYSFIEGKPFQQKDIAQKHILTCIDFYISINNHKKKANNINKASDSCLTYKDYVFSISKRLSRLTKSSCKIKKNQKTLNHITKTLHGLWGKILNKSEKIKSIFDLPKNDYRLSPSDFGFHNVLKDDNNNLFFIDFEYAGWDDPAKTICDFFTQPKIEIPYKYFDSTIENIALTLDSHNDFKRKIELIFPISQIKWCCIILNSFLAVNFIRRDFAQANEDEGRQLEKALILLKKIKI